MVKLIMAGDVFKTNLYGDVMVVSYEGSKNITIKFLNTGYERITNSGGLARGSVLDKSVLRRNPNKVKPFAKVMELAKAIHGDTYIYAEGDYVNMRTHMPIECKKHGMFRQTPEKHTTGQGCPKCGTERSASAQSYTTAEYVSEAISKHGNKYDYSLVNYTSAHSKIRILCKTHGEFMQTPASHLTGCGCRECNNKGWFKPTEKSKLYIFTTECGIVKVGVTNDTVSVRAYHVSYTAGIKFEVATTYDLGMKSLKVEQSLLKVMRTKYTKLNKVFNGSTECFTGCTVEDIKSLIDREISE